MALPTGPCAVDEVCCDDLFVVAERILLIAHTAVLECIADSPCPVAEVVGYVSVGSRIEDPQPDRLVVSLTNIYPSPGSADNHGSMKMPLMRAAFQVQLLESGWPNVHGDSEQMIPPQPDDYMNAALHAFGHGEAMYRALRVAFSTGQIDPRAKRGCYQRLDPLQAIEPSGGTVGWQTAVTVDARF